MDDHDGDSRGRGAEDAPQERARRRAGGRRRPRAAAAGGRLDEAKHALNWFELEEAKQLFQQYNSFYIEMHDAQGCGCGAPGQRASADARRLGAAGGGRRPEHVGGARAMALASEQNERRSSLLAEAPFKTTSMAETPWKLDVLASSAITCATSTSTIDVVDAASRAIRDAKPLSSSSQK